MSLSDFFFPGKEIGQSSKLAAGPGTYVTEDGRTRASVIGSQRISKLQSAGNAAVGLPSKSNVASIDQRKVMILPNVGSQVYARVLRMTQREVVCSIIVVDTAEEQASQAGVSASQSTTHVLAHPFRGLLRSIDVRATQKDTVVLSDCFRVGDIIRARVISLGDQGGYYLTTAGNDFGVVMSWSDSGFSCVPINWKEVQDEVTGAIEGRKVAKPT